MVVFSEETTSETFDEINDLDEILKTMQDFHKPLLSSTDDQEDDAFSALNDELSPVMEGYINTYVSSPESLVSDLSSVATNEDLLAAIDPGASPPRPKNYSFQITYVNFPQKFFKKQIRLNKDSMQRIDNGEVSFLIEFATKEERKAAQFISVKVKRTQENIDSTRRLGEVFIQSQLSCVQDTKVLVKLDLDSVYEQNGQRVYELDKSLNEEQKRFHLKVEVHFANKQVVIQNTHCFTVAGKRRKPTVGDKRGYSDSSCSDNSVDFSVTSSPSSGFYSSDNVNADKCSVIACGKLVADHIKTKTITLDTMNIGETITTSHGDIAYSFPLEDKDDEFEEGEVVGFKLNREGKYTLIKLTALNSMEVELHGVITRSFYLQAKVPLDGSHVETVCMMGIIPVQVVGVVKAGDTLYASQDHPGKVEARHGNGKLIGYAFANYTPSKEDLEHKKLGMVQAGVSVLDCASKALQNVRLNELKEDFEVKFESESKRSKRSRKCIYTCMALSTVILILLGVLLYQYFMPGSAMRTAICKMGSEHGTCKYNFIPFSNIYDYPQVNGVEFTFENLMKKMSYNYNRLDQPGVRYFMNIDRCSYGQLKRTTDIALALKRVYGPTVFAVDQRCYHAYYYDEPKDKWVQYNSVDWEKRRNIFCHPRSKWKGGLNARMED